MIASSIEIHSKQPDLNLSIFAVMSKLASEHQAVNLSQGFPDFDPSPELVNLVAKYMKQGYNQYAPMPGVAALREAIARKTNDLYGTSYDPGNEITVTAGATEALYAAITSTVHPGDEVIVFEPWYDAYVPVIGYNGGKPVFIKMKLPDYHIDWTEVKNAVTGKTRAIIINSPHNPSGKTLSTSDIQSLKSIVSGTNIIIISDEVYEHIIFDGRDHLSMSRYPDLAARSMVISSFGKTYHTTGWKVGYCLAPKELTDEFRKIHQFITYAVNTPVQYAYAEFLSKKDLYMGLSDFYQKKRDLFLDLIKGSRFNVLSCRGTYFQLLDYSGISDEKEMDFAIRLTKEYQIASIPTSVFYNQNDNNHVLRFCFAKKEETLKKAAEKLCRI
ncbi:MAG: methionine aminotransferase [Calditrichaceae bacterium]